MRFLLFYITILYMILLNGCDSSKQSLIENNQTNIINIKVHNLKKEPYSVHIDFTGKSEAIDLVDVVSRIKGELLDINFTAGRYVHKDDILFHIDPKEYQAQYDKAKAILQKDKATLSLAQATIKRYEPLVKEQLVSKEKLDQLKASVYELKSLIKADEAQLQEAHLNLGYCDIRASIDGYIGKSSKLVGNLVNIGDKLTHIVNSKQLYIYFTPSIEETALIKKFAKDPYPNVEVTLNGDTFKSVKLKGKVDFIDTKANSSTNTVSFRAIVDNPKGMIYSGSFVHISLDLGKYDALALHPDQISQDQGGEFVYIVDKNNTLQKRYITPSFANNDMVFVAKGLEPNDRVVVGLFHSLIEGAKVNPQEVDNPIKVN